MKSNEPLLVKKMGVKFYGGIVTVDKEGHERYCKHSSVHYIFPQEKKHRYPIVMLPGGFINASTYISTPSDEDGWAILFAKEGYDVYVVDEAESGASGFDILPRNGETEADETFYHWPAAPIWPRWGIGSDENNLFPNSRFTKVDKEQFYRSFVPALANNTGFPYKKRTRVDALLAFLEKIGPAIVLSHSASGVTVFDAALERPELFKAIISVEPVEAPIDVKNVGDIYKYIDFLGVFADNREQRQKTGSVMQDKFNAVSKLIEIMKEHGGNAKMIDLPAIGIKGNSHFPMFEDNLEEVADLINNWLIEQGY